MSIAIIVKHCLDRFKLLQQAAFAIDESGVWIEDESSRFKIWCGNLSAHRPAGNRSLEHRLRDSSNLKAQVLKLLQALLEALDKCIFEDLPQLYVLFEYSDHLALGEQYVAMHPEDSEASSEEDEESFEFEFDELAIQQTHPRQRVHDTLDLLYSFSMALRQPAGHDRIRHGESSISQYYLPFDLDRVRSKYPGAGTILQERLGRAMSTRRQYLNYRMNHHAKLAAGVDSDENRSDKDVQSTVATSILESQDISSVRDSGSVRSTTSYALTESETGVLRPPPLPPASQDNAFFECPICFTIQQFTSQELWHRHVYEDLQPYCCTINDCNLRHVLFSRRRDWQRHQTKMHTTAWVCSFGCTGVHTSSASQQKHLLRKHHHEPNDALLSNILDASSAAATIHGSAACPLCGKALTTGDMWYRHVGRHMEQLALSSLPSHLLVDESDVEVSDEESLSPTAEHNNYNTESIPDDTGFQPPTDENTSGEYNVMYSRRRIPVSTKDWDSGNEEKIQKRDQTEAPSTQAQVYYADSSGDSISSLYPEPDV